MSAYITATARACFAALRQIRSVRRSLAHDALLTLLRAHHKARRLMSTVSGSLMQRLQSVLNAVAQQVFSVRRSEHTTPLLREQ